MTAGSLGKIANEFQVSKRTVQYLYTRYTSQIEKGILVPDMSSKKRSYNCGRDPKITEELAVKITALVSLMDKKKVKVTARGLAAECKAQYDLSIPYTTIYHYYRKLTAL